MLPDARTTCSDAAANAQPPNTNARMNANLNNFFTANLLKGCGVRSTSSAPADPRPAAADRTPRPFDRAGGRTITVVSLGSTGPNANYKPPVPFVDPDFPAKVSGRSARRGRPPLAHRPRAGGPSPADWGAGRAPPPPRRAPPPVARCRLPPGPIRRPTSARRSPARPRTATFPATPPRRRRPAPAPALRKRIVPPCRPRLKATPHDPARDDGLRPGRSRPPD